MDESMAIKLCLEHRDPAGFEFLVKKYRREAFYHARGFLIDQEDAADACQESFMRAFKAIPRLKKLDTFYPWFYTILRNHCLNVLSKRKTAAKYQQEERFSAMMDREFEGPSRALEKKEHTEFIWKVIDQLIPDFREILVMKYFQEHSYNEISEILNIPRGTVMSRLYYARKAFKKIYEKKAAVERSICDE